MATNTEVAPRLAEARGRHGTTVIFSQSLPNAKPAIGFDAGHYSERL